MVQTAGDDSDTSVEEEGEEKGKEEMPLRMTPLELDLHYQVAELVFRSLLEGKRLGVHPSEETEGVNSWHQSRLGESWIQQNRRMQKEVRKQMKASGENTPMWTEAHASMSDIAWEVFTTEDGCEKVRKLKDMDRREVLEQLRELHPKLRDSYYARCGAGSKLYALRAFVAIFHTFMRDTEVMDWCSKCFRLVITDHPHNRDRVCQISVPVLPAVRDSDTEDRGWSFLRRALDALMVQAGSDPFGGFPAEEAEEDGGETGEERAAERGTPNYVPKRQVAVQIAECIVAAKESLPIQLQLRLLQEPVPEGACAEHRELKQMVPSVFDKVQQLAAEEGDEALAQLLEMLQWAEPAGRDPPELVEPGGAQGGAGPGGSPDSQGGLFQGIALGMRGLLGR